MPELLEMLYADAEMVGALGFEPRSAGVFPVQLEPAVLPGYTIPPKECIVLGPRSYDNLGSWITMWKALSSELTNH